MKQQLFFIVGSQRSGTTLLRLILNSHPLVRVYEENLSYDKLRDKTYTRKKIAGFKIPIWTRKHNFLCKKFPQARYIFMRRRIEGVVCSMLNLKINGTTWKDRWINKWGVNDLKRSIRGISNISLRYFYRKQIKDLEKKQDYTLLATLCAYVKTNLYDEYVKKRMPVLLIHYEDLVTHQKKTIQKILDFLHIPWHDRVLQHHRLHKNLWGGTRGSRPIDKKSLNKWKTYFSKKDLQRIHNYVTFLDKHRS